MKRLILITIFAGMLFSGSVLAQTWYPNVNTSGVSNAWNIGSIGDGLNNVDKLVNLSSSTTIMKNVFYSFRLSQVRIGTGSYTWFSGLETTSSSCYHSSSSGNRYCQFEYDVIGKNLYVYIDLYTDGRYELYAYWGSGETGISNSQIWFRIDYDLNGTDGSWQGIDDIYETASIVSGDYRNWTGNESENEIIFTPFSLVTNEDIENNAFFRIFDYSSTGPGNMFGSIVFPPWETTSWNTETAIRTMRWTSDYDDFNGVPLIDPTDQIQRVQTGTSGHQPAAYQADLFDHDKVVYIGLEMHPTWDDCGFQGQIYQKPNGRSLNINLFVQNGTPRPDVNRVTSPQSGSNHGQTIKEALDDLTNNRWKETAMTGLTHNLGTGDLTPAQVYSLHELWRNQYLSSYSVHGNLKMEDNWNVDALVVNNRLDNATFGQFATGAMFDFSGWVATDFNDYRHEGSIIPWGEIENEPCAPSFGTTCTTADQQIAALDFHGMNYLHEVAHNFEFRHVNNTNWVMDGVLRDNRHRWTTWHRNWYQKGPESWIKSGKYGNRDGWANTETFNQYFTGTSCSSANCP